MRTWRDELWDYHVRSVVKRVKKLDKLRDLDENNPLANLPPAGPYAPAPPNAEIPPDIRTEDAHTNTANVTFHPSEKTIKMHVADTPALRQTGLQNRVLGPDPDSPDGDGIGGMLFKWPMDTKAKFHNQGVNFPVSAAFFDSSGMYRDHFSMLPNDSQARTALHSHRYAVEMHRDAADAMGLGPNTSISVDDEKEGPKPNPVV